MPLISSLSWHIYASICRKDLNALKYHCKHVNTNSVLWNGEPILAVAIKQNCDLLMIKYIITKGSDPNALMASGITILQYLAQQKDYQHPEVITLLVSHGADFSKCVKGLTPLTYACKANNITGVRLLVSAKASINPTTKNDWSPLMYAIQNKNSVIVYILTRRAKESTEYTPLDFFGHQALDGNSAWTIAKKTRISEFTELMIYNGFSSDDNKFSKNAVCDAAEFNNQIKESIDKICPITRQTLIEQTIKKFNWPYAISLLERGAKLPIYDDNGLHILIALLQYYGYIMETEGWHPTNTHILHKFIRMVMKTTPNINAPDHDGKTVLMWIVQSKWLHGLITNVMNAKADITIMDYAGMNVFHYAIKTTKHLMIYLFKKSNPDYVSKLLNYASFGKSLSPLSAAIMYSKLYFVRKYVEMGADVFYNSDDSIIKLIYDGKNSYYTTNRRNMDYNYFVPTCIKKYAMDVIVPHALTNIKTKANDILTYVVPSIGNITPLKNIILDYLPMSVYNDMDYEYTTTSHNLRDTRVYAI